MLTVIHICCLIIAITIIGQAIVIFWLSRKIVNLEFWIRRFDEVLDPEGTGDVYVKNNEFRRKIKEREKQ